MKIYASRVERARREGLVLVDIVLDGRYAPDAQTKIRFTGAIPTECRAELLAMVRRWTSEGKF